MKKVSAAANTLNLANGKVLKEQVTREFNDTANKWSKQQNT